MMSMTICKEPCNLLINKQNYLHRTHYNLLSIKAWNKTEREFYVHSKWFGMLFLQIHHFYTERLPTHYPSLQCMMNTKCFM